MHKGIGSLVSRFNKVVQQMEKLHDGGEAPRGSHVPRHLDMKKIFRLDINDEIWNDDGLSGLDDDSPPPRWLADDNVQEGIAALLDCD